MYVAMIILLLLVFPATSVGAEVVLSKHAVTIMALVGRWFVFWAVGVRLFIAGMRQVVQPRFTAENIFGIHDPACLPIVREVGFANLSIGLLGVCSLFRPDWVVPAAIVGGAYYGLAGLGHIRQNNKNAKEYMAMISDAFAFVVLLAFLINTLS